jgi:hypothetical protein
MLIVPGDACTPLSAMIQAVRDLRGDRHDILLPCEVYDAYNSAFFVHRRGDYSRVSFSPFNLYEI